MHKWTVDSRHTGCCIGLGSDIAGLGLGSDVAALDYVPKYVAALNWVLL